MNETLANKIANLSMKPADWFNLDKLVKSDEYRKIVNDYQARERARLPLCTSAFGLCTCYDRGVCCCKDSCKFQHHQPRED